MSRTFRKSDRSRQWTSDDFDPFQARKAERQRRNRQRERDEEFFN
jgi:hypothetical protein